MNGIFFNDDAQVVQCMAEKFYSNNPRTEIFIGEIQHAMPKKNSNE